MATTPISAHGLGNAGWMVLSILDFTFRFRVCRQNHGNVSFRLPEKPNTVKPRPPQYQTLPGASISRIGFGAQLGGFRV